MPYRMEVFSLSQASIPVSQIQAILQKKEIQATIDVDPGEEDCWTAIHLAHKHNGDHIAFVERELVLPNSLADRVIAEKISYLGETKPPTAARYLRGFLQRVKTIYFFQILYAADRDDGWKAIHTVQSQMIDELRGILHSDLEGFRNEEGFQITWEFVDSVKGECAMAVLDPNDRWIAFRMELGNKEHRAAFCEGRIPPGLNTWNLGSARILKGLE
jgi:hypothetical protein